MRHGVEDPRHLAGDRVVGAQIAGRRFVLLAGGGALQDQVAKDAARSLRADLTDRLGIAAQAGAQIDAAMVSKRADDVAGARVQRHQVVVHDFENAAIGAVLARPVHQPAAVEVGHLAVVVQPNLLAGGRVERGHAIVPGDDIHRAIDRDRVGAVAKAVIAGGIEPHLAQLFHIRLIDLREGRVLRVVRRAAVFLPGGVRRRRRCAGASRRCVHRRPWAQPQERHPGENNRR